MAHHGPAGEVFVQCGWRHTGGRWMGAEAGGRGGTAACRGSRAVVPLEGRRSPPGPSTRSPGPKTLDARTSSQQDGRSQNREGDSAPGHRGGLQDGAFGPRGSRFCRAAGRGGPEPRVLGPQRAQRSAACARFRTTRCTQAAHGRSPPEDCAPRDLAIAGMASGAQNSAQTAQERAAGAARAVGAPRLGALVRRAPCSPAMPSSPCMDAPVAKVRRA